MSNTFPPLRRRQSNKLLTWKQKKQLFFMFVSMYFVFLLRLVFTYSSKEGCLPKQKWDRFQKVNSQNRDCELRQEDSIGKARPWDTQRQEGRESNGDRKRQTGRESASMERTYRLRYDIHQMDRLIGLLNQSLATTLVCVCVWPFYAPVDIRRLLVLVTWLQMIQHDFACLEIIKPPFGACWTLALRAF